MLWHCTIFQRETVTKDQRSSVLTVSFDESFKTDFQKKQMDITVHYFYEERVVTQYFDSQFLGHTTAGDLLNSLKTSLSKLNNRKILQISMDGPRVNWKIFSCYVKKERRMMLIFQNY